MPLSDPYTIRPFKPSDARPLAEIQVNSYQVAYAGLLPEDYLAGFNLDEQEQDWMGWLAGHPQDLLLVAVHPPAELIGYALARSQADWPGYASELLALHMCPDWQGRGIGRSLVRACAAQLQAQGCTSLMVWVLSGNQRARRFYEKLGGKLLGDRSVSFDDEPGGFKTSESAFGWERIADLV